MHSHIGKSIDALDSPQLLIDLDVVDANLQRMLAAFAGSNVNVRVHFKSLKCGNLARYLADQGVISFLCAKLNEAEVLADAGIRDIFVANQLIGSTKLKRLAQLARRAKLSVCVDDARNVRELGEIAKSKDVQIGVLVEVDIGMARCGVEPGEPALQLAKQVRSSLGLRFLGLQGYDGHLQMIPDVAERRAKCLEGLEKLVATRQMIEAAGIPVSVVTGAGTGTWEFVGSHEGITEIQPGSFVLMDHAYHAVRPEFKCAMSVYCTVISKRPGWYVLDAGSKAISKDFGMPAMKSPPGDTVAKLSEEHTKVESGDETVRVGDRFEVIPTHGCATMNLHRHCVAVRKGRIEAIWPIEASGRYD